jgi:hypothetical protein
MYFRENIRTKEYAKEDATTSNKSATRREACCGEKLPCGLSLSLFKTNKFQNDYKL